MAQTQDEEIIRLIDQIYGLKDNFLAPSSSSGSQRKELLEQLGTSSRKLMLAVQEPHEEFWQLIRRCSLLSPIKVAQDMGVFRHLHEHDSATAKELASISGGDESLIVRILRPLVAEGLLGQVDEESYSLTTRGKTFGVQAYEDSTAFAIQFMPIVLSNPTFFRENGYRESRSHEGLDTPLAAHFQKPGYGFFDYLQDNPDIQKVFVGAMKAQLKSTRLTSSAYNYEEQLSTASTEDGSDVAIVDVGGSRGELLQEVKARYPELKGRMIVQDRQATFDCNPPQSPGIELMVHDIFTEQPIKGATAYHLKRIFHDWSDDKCRIILKHLVSAMDKERSRILIMEAVLPTINASFSQAMSDHSMLTFGGKERSEKQWEELLRSVGLTVERIYRGSESEAVIDCRKI